MVESDSSNAVEILDRNSLHKIFTYDCLDLYGSRFNEDEVGWIRIFAERKVLFQIEVIYVFDLGAINVPGTGIRMKLSGMPVSLLVPAVEYFWRRPFDVSPQRPGTIGPEVRFAGLHRAC